MCGGLVPVTIECKTLPLRQLGKVRQTIRQLGGGDDRQIDFTRQVHPSLTLEGEETVRQPRRFLEPRTVFLEKSASAHHRFERPLDAQAQPLVIGKFRTGAGERTGGNEALDRLEKGGVHMERGGSFCH